MYETMPGAARPDEPTGGAPAAPAPPWLAAGPAPGAPAPAPHAPSRQEPAPHDPARHQRSTAWQPGPHAPAPQLPAPPQPFAPHPPPQPFAPHPPAPPQPAGPAGGPEQAALPDLGLLPAGTRPPARGWRRALHRATGGRVNPGESRAEAARRELIARVDRPVHGDHRIAVLSLKGGVGKTTTTVGLGSVFASVRGDRVIAVDANPDLGTLAQRVRVQTTSTARGLLQDPRIHRYADVRAHTSQAPSRLEVLASERDPAVSEAFSGEDYREVLGILRAHYNLILTDCGTGLMHSAMSGVLDTADCLVLVTSPAVDGARSALATLDWLDHHGKGALVDNAVVVINSAARGPRTVPTARVESLFAHRCRAVRTIPYDPHLAEGAVVDLARLAPRTHQALLALAGDVAEGFPPAAPGDGVPSDQ